MVSLNGKMPSLECFAKHETTSTHKEAVIKLSSAAKVNICAMLDAKMEEQQLQRQHMLQKYQSSVRYLARQGLAFRGYEEKEGNMMQLLQMWSLYDADIKHWLRDGKYLSHIINEQIKLMGDHILRVMLSEIRSCMFLPSKSLKRLMLLQMSRCVFLSVGSAKSMRYLRSQLVLSN